MYVCVPKAINNLWHDMDSTLDYCILLVYVHMVELDL